MKRFVSIVIAMFMMFSSLVPVMAMTSVGEIDLKLNQSVYAKGQEVVLSAVIKKEGATFANGELLVTIKNENTQEVILVKQLTSGAAGEASTKFTINDATAAGSYLVTVNAVGTVGTTKFLVSDHVASVTMDKTNYQVGEVVKISGTLALDGKALVNRTALVKVSVKDQVVFVKELLSGDNGQFSTAFTLSNTLGTYNLQLTATGIDLTKSFEVVERIPVMVYAIEGKTNKDSYKGGEEIKVFGKATTTKDGVEMTQTPILVLLTANGIVLESKSVEVAKNGQYATEFRAENKTIQYDVVLKNQTTEKKIRIAVIADAGNNGNNNGNNNNNGNGGVNNGGGNNGVPPTTTPGPKNTGQTKPVVTPKSGNRTVEISAASVEKKMVGTVETVTIKEADLLTIVDQILELGKTDKRPIDIVFDMKDVGSKEMKISVGTDSLKKLENLNSNLQFQTKNLKVTLPLENINLKQTGTQIAFESKIIETPANLKTGTLNVSKVSQIYDFNLSTEKAGVKTAIKEFGKAIDMEFSLAGLGLDQGKTILAYVNAEGSMEMAGNKVFNNILKAKIKHFSQYAIVERNVSYADTSTHWANKYVASMGSKDIVKGYGNGEFGPEKSITRAEFVTMLVKAQGLEPMAYTGGFADVNNTHWAKDYIQTARANGLIATADAFRPNDNITRAEMAVMIAKGLKMESGTAANYSDNAKIPAWAKDAIVAVSTMEIMSGSNNQFRPNDKTTRAEASVVLYKIFNIE